MAKRKKNNDDLGPSNLWKAVKILFLLAVGYGLGWNFGYVSGEDDGRSQARAAMSNASDNGAQNSSEVSDTDAYGRSPGHPHYGHNHN